MNKVAALSVKCRRGGVFPLPLWQWMTTTNIINLTVWRQLAPSPDAQPHPRIQEISVGLYPESIRFLDVSNVFGKSSIILLMSRTDGLACPSKRSHLVPSTFRRRHPSNFIIQTVRLSSFSNTQDHLARRFASQFPCAPVRLFMCPRCHYPGSFLS
jgi:hypothetical protein